MALRPKQKRKAKGGVQRNDQGLRTAAEAYLSALERRDSFRSALSTQLAQMAELEAQLVAAEHECTLQSQRHLVGKKTSVTSMGVRFSRSQRSSRVISAETLLSKYPKLHRVEGLFKVMAGAFDKVAASGAYNGKVLAAAVHTDTTFRYHVEKKED